VAAVTADLAKLLDKDWEDKSLDEVLKVRSARSPA
jgi:hypothetical protein